MSRLGEQKSRGEREKFKDGGVDRIFTATLRGPRALKSTLRSLWSQSESEVLCGGPGSPDPHGRRSLWREAF